MSLDFDDFNYGTPNKTLHKPPGLDQTAVVPGKTVTQELVETPHHVPACPVLSTIDSSNEDSPSSRPDPETYIVSTGKSVTPEPVDAPLSSDIHMADATSHDEPLACPGEEIAEVRLDQDGDDEQAGDVANVSKLKLAAKSLTHLLTHLPTNSFCQVRGPK